MIMDMWVESFIVFESFTMAENNNTLQRVFEIIFFIHQQIISFMLFKRYKKTVSSKVSWFLADLNFTAYFNINFQLDFYFSFS